MSNRLLYLAAVMCFGAGMTTASAETPCPSWGDYNEFGECKVLVEINASDGDVGFHFLVDGDSLIRTSLFNPHWHKIWSYSVKKEAKDQTFTESFNESAEPLCFDPLLDDDAADEETFENNEEDFRTLAEFVDLWKNGPYFFVGVDNEWAWAVGKTYLTFNLPAAPNEVDFELEEEDGDIEGEISWQMGDSLGMCTEFEDLPDGVTLVTETGTGEEGDERIVAWEIVLEPEFEDDDPNAQKGLKFAMRVGAADLECEWDDGECIFEQEIPDDYLESLPENTLVKAEVGAITSTDNATFSEEGEWCVNDTFPEGGIYDEDEDAFLNGCGEEVEVDD
ncbi:MAG TPA: hypothetical protein VLA11_09935 [Woeseiaceae bacterium]|jgi:hypothetical protein|nr:hypothetical protein [Woeseiaceae bacterium]